MEKLNELVDLAKNATSGKWIADSGEGWDAIVSQQDMVNDNFIIGEFIGPDSKANKDFVLAANPETILAIAEACSVLERRVEAAEAEVQRLNATAQPVSDGLYRIANHIAGAKNSLPQEWQDWADEIESDLRKLAASPGGQ